MARWQSGSNPSCSLEIQSNEPVVNQAKCVAAANREDERQKNQGRKATQIDLTVMATPSSIIGVMSKVLVPPKEWKRKSAKFNSDIIRQHHRPQSYRLRVGEWTYIYYKTFSEACLTSPTASFSLTTPFLGP